MSLRAQHRIRAWALDGPRHTCMRLGPIGTVAGRLRRQSITRVFQQLQGRLCAPTNLWGTRDGIIVSALLHLTQIHRIGARTCKTARFLNAPRRQGIFFLRQEMRARTRECYDPGTDERCMPLALWCENLLPAQAPPVPRRTQPHALVARQRHTRDGRANLAPRSTPNAVPPASTTDLIDFGNGNASADGYFSREPS